MMRHANPVLCARTAQSERRAVQIGLVIALTASSSFGQLVPEFQGLGFLPDGNKSWTSAVSADGTVVVGYGRVPPLWFVLVEAFRWTPSSGMEGLGYVGSCQGQCASKAFGVSADGTFIVGQSEDYAVGDVAPFVWSESGGMTGLPWLDPDVTEGAALSVSLDGSVIAGWSNSWDWDCPCSTEYPTRWTSGAPAALSMPGGCQFPYGTAFDVSADGTVILGAYTFDGECESYIRQSVLWVDGAPVVLRDLLGFELFAGALSSNGRYVAGYDRDTGEGFLWDRQEDAVTRFDPLPGNDQLYPTGLSSAGAIVGWSNGTAGRHLFIWELVGGMRDLVAEIDSWGLDIEGWDLSDGNVTDISANGITIVGYAPSPSADDEGWRLVLPRDTDGDGLYDHWEIDGIDVDKDGTVDLDLPALGADPYHKNLFVEVDSATLALPNEAALDLVRASFANAPNALVNNSDGEDGVTLYIDVDETELSLPDPWEVPEDHWFPSDFDEKKDLYFGTPAERAHPHADDLLKIKRQIFRYVVYCENLSNGTLGVARDYWSNDFIIALQSIFAACDGDCNVLKYEAGVFMHELGHCLNLRHGGDDDINLKPNYISVMNYLRKLPFKEGDPLWRLDYSHGGMQTLDEASLDESVGFGDTTAINHGTWTYFSKYACNPGDPPCMVDPIENAPLGSMALQNMRPVDFDNNGTIENAVCADLNYYGENSIVASGDIESPCQMLHDHNDWSNLKYELVNEEAAAPRDSEPIIELTVEMVQELQDILPEPCIPDLTGDGIIDVGDLLALLAGWGPCDPETCGTDLNFDGMVDTADLLALLAAWGECP